MLLLLLIITKLYFLSSIFIIAASGGLIVLRPGVSNPRPAGCLWPSGEICAAREGYFTKNNAL